MPALYVSEASYVSSSTKVLTDEILVGCKVVKGSSADP